MRNFCAYIDESGQDTHGNLFVVSVVVTGEEKEWIATELERIEKESGKRNIKWHKANHECRRKYIEDLARIENFHQLVFFDTFHDSKEYIDLTSLAAAKAVLRKTGGEDYKASIFIDGFKKKEVEFFSRGLRDLRVKTKKIRGVKKDENNVYIRLADALCGLVRDAYDGNEWSKKVLEKLIKKKYVVRL